MGEIIDVNEFLKSNTNYNRSYYL